MNSINNSYSNVSFGAKITDGVMSRVTRQAKIYKNYVGTKDKLQKQITEIPNWGSPESLVVITKNKLGNYCLGVRIKVAEDTYLSWAMDRLKGKTELSQFLNMTSRDIEDTEKTIKWLYKNRGLEPFIKCMK